VQQAAVEAVADAAVAAGFRRVATTAAAITGATGNQEFFLHLVPASVLP
jgi:predicted rRNA methylase YqxC with S4 and FtsJ domains